MPRAGLRRSAADPNTKLTATCTLPASSSSSSSSSPSVSVSLVAARPIEAGETLSCDYSGGRRCLPLERLLPLPQVQGRSATESEPTVSAAEAEEGGGSSAASSSSMVDVLDQLSIALHAACSCDEHLSPLDGKGVASEQGQASLPLLLPAHWVGARLRALMAALPATHWCLCLR